jgi:hypothetical protein
MKDLAYFCAACALWIAWFLLAFVLMIGCSEITGKPVCNDSPAHCAPMSGPGPGNGR